jgi:hypothetical protein
MQLKAIVTVVFVTVVSGCLSLMSVAEVAGADSKALGVWSSATLDEIAAVGRPQCVSMRVTQRTVTLKTVPGQNKIGGEWVRWTRLVWLNSDSLCRWFPEEAQYEPLLAAVWTYAVSGDNEGQQIPSFRIAGAYSACLGNACNRWAHDERFETEMRLVGDKLVDTNKTADPTDDVEFVRLVDAQDLLDDARTAAEGLLKSLDLGQIDRFYDLATTSSFRSNTKREDFHKRVSDAQARLGLESSRKYLIATHVLYAPMIKTGRDDYVIFSNKVTTARGASFFEFVFLVRENKAWKVSWLF